MNEKLKKRLLALMWDELRDWSVARSVERGRGYLSCVEPPVLSPDGGLVAEVHGTEYKRRPKFVAMLDALTSGRGASSRIADW